MDMVYEGDTLFIDLCGNVDISNLKTRIFSVIEQYNISNVIIDATDMFNYKRKNFNGLLNDYSKISRGNIKIRRY